jgi:mannose/fructose/N-acetylgalactosamine-specific phosphotransferase system component IIB
MYHLVKHQKTFRNIYIPPDSRVTFHVPELQIGELSGKNIIVYKKNLSKNTSTNKPYKVTQKDILKIHYTTRTRTIYISNENNYPVSAKLIIIEYLSRRYYLVPNEYDTPTVKETQNDQATS